MTLQEQNMAIAEACGWQRWKSVSGSVRLLKPNAAQAAYWEECGDMLTDESLTVGTKIPNYVEDLNACAEMEKTLPEDTLRNYCEWLSTLSRWPSLATAAQRAEAFLRTLNLWRE